MQKRRTEKGIEVFTEQVWAVLEKPIVEKEGDEKLGAKVWVARRGMVRSVVVPGMMGGCSSHPAIYRLALERSGSLSIDSVEVSEYFVFETEAEAFEEAKVLNDCEVKEIQKQMHRFEEIKAIVNVVLLEQVEHIWNLERARQIENVE